MNWQRFTRSALLSLLASITGAIEPACAAEARAAIAPIGEISARGRIEPKDGVRKVAGPSQQAIFINVISELRVKEGDRVRAGDVIAVTDTFRVKQATIDRLRAELDDAERELNRARRLHQTNVLSDAEHDQRSTARRIAKAALDGAEADLELAMVRAPISGKILKIHAHPGERIELDGLLEIGQTDEMYVVAEVYESDIERVRIGAAAVATTPSLSGELRGKVEEIGWRVGKMDVLDTDPAARTDARVVEVKIRLDDGSRVERLTHMQVEVKIAGAGS